MKKYSSIYPRVTSSSSSLTLGSMKTVEDIDVDDILSEVDRDVNRILHTNYMDKLGGLGDRGDNNRGGDGTSRGIPRDGCGNVKADMREQIPHLKLQRNDSGELLSDQGRKGVDDTRNALTKKGGLETLTEAENEVMDGYETRREAHTPPDSHNGSSDSSDSDEDVMFSHTQTDSCNPQSTLEDLRTLMKDVNQKLEESNESRREIERLKFAIHDLEEENIDLHEAVEEAVKHVNQVNTTQALSSATRMSQQSFRKVTTDKRAKSSSDFLDLDQDDEVDLVDLDLQTNPLQLVKIIEAWIEKRFPFKYDIQRVHAVFGGTVSAYFLFNRWLVLQYSLVSSMVFVFIVYHLIAQYRAPGIWGFSSGLLPNFMLFSSFDESERFNYSLMVVVGMMIMLVNVMLKYIREDRLNKEEKLTEGENYKDSYSKDVLIAWDNSLSSEQEVEDYKGSLAQLYEEKLKDSEEAGIKKALSDLDKVMLYLRRFVGFLLFLAFQSMMYALIIYLTINTAEVKTMVEDFNPALSTIAGSIPSIGVNIINGISPMVIELITGFEKWDRTQTLNYLLSRMYIANMMNVLILGLSYMLLANPYLLADRDNLYIREQIEAPFLPDLFPCRMDMVQNGMTAAIIC